jgi:hypothetical protein
MRIRTTIVAVVGAVALMCAGTGTVAHASERTYRTEHFALTWSDDRSDPDAPDLTDNDGDGVPDAVTRMATAFEDARAFLLDDLGYQEPPTRGRYNLYVSSAIDRGLTRTAPGGEGRSKPSFITIPKYLMRASATTARVRAFAVHEYFHAIQLGYDAGEDRWIQEASSAWVEALFEPDEDHNHGYLYEFVPRLELGLTSESGLHHYGAFLFLQFLTERYGGGARQGAGIVRALWEAMAVPEARGAAPDDDSMGALQRVLADHGVTLAGAWGEFLVWAWQLHRFEDGIAYRKALRDQRWPTAPATSVSEETCRLVANASDGVLPALGADFARFIPASRSGTRARLTVRGPAGATAFAIVRPAAGSAVINELTFDDAGVGATDLDFGGTSARRVIVGLGNGSLAPATLEYSLRLEGADSVSADAPSMPSTTIYGTGVSASGRVFCGPAPAPFARVVVTRTEVVSGATESLELVTDALGQWRLTTTPPATSTYEVEVVDPLLSAATSPPSTVGVRVAVSMSMARDQVADGEPVVVEGSVTPVHSGSVVLERRRPNGAFETAAETTVDGDGGYRFEHVLPAPGLWEVRVVMHDTGDDDHLPGDSAPKLVQVGET